MLSKLKAFNFEDDNFDGAHLVQWTENIVEKGDNAGYQFSFPHDVFEGFSRSYWYCVVGKGLSAHHNYLYGQ